MAATSRWAAVGTIDASGVRSDPRLRGTVLWGWSKFMAWPPHSSHVFEPGQPPSAVLSYLGTHL